MVSFTRLTTCLAAVVLIATSSGCSAVNRFVPGGAGFASAADKNLAVNPDELPPRQTAQACIKTAEQLASDGQAREAILLYEKARGVDPNATNYSRRLAPLYDLSDDVARATTEFNAAIATAPADADLLNDAGCFYDRQGNPAQAERLLRQAVAVNPQYARAQINLGLAIGHQGRFQEAFDVFAPVVGPAAAHSNVGMLLAKQGRNEEALRALQQALALNANLPQTRAVIEHLERCLSLTVANARPPLASVVTP